MAKHKTDDYKISAVKYYLKSKKTQEEICNIFDCSPRSLKRWTARYTKDKTIKRYNRKPISYKVKKTHVKFIIDEVSKNKTITMDDLLGILKNKYKNINITSRHLSRIIRDNNITLKANINKVIRNISLAKFLNIFKGAYERKEKYIKRGITRKRIPKKYK